MSTRPTKKIKQSDCKHHWVWRIGELAGQCVDCEALVTPQLRFIELGKETLSGKTSK